MNIAEKLAQLLERNAELYEELSAKSLEEREAIENDGLEKLSSLVVEKESIVHGLRGIEIKRLALATEMAELLGMEPNATLKEIASHPDVSGERTRLLAGSERLREAVEKHNEINDFNRNLLAASMEFIRKSMTFAANVVEESTTYASGKILNVPVPSGSMLREEY